MTKHEQMVEMLNQLEDTMIKVELENNFEKKDWVALSRVVHFLLKEYVRNDKN